MKPSTLITRYILKETEGEGEAVACLLLVDDQVASTSALGEQLRSAIDQNPLVRSIYVAAPNLNTTELQQMLEVSVAAQRTSAISTDHGPQFLIIDLCMVDGGLDLLALPLISEHPENVSVGTWSPIDQSLINGWLFNLFDTSKALVEAPTGVHFAKSSGRHSNKFLRTSSTLMSSASCGFIAMVALARTCAFTPRRIFVDTAPLLSVAYAMHHVAHVRQFWDSMPQSQSFSSYGGFANLPKLATGDLVLVSASTSGGLADGLLKKGLQENMLVTLFYLGQDAHATSKGIILCNLTSNGKSLNGYPPLKSYTADNCTFCNSGDVLAELEGDQFLIERRKVKLLRLTGDTQEAEHRRVFEKICRNRVVKTRVNETSRRLTRVELSPSASLEKIEHLLSEFSRLINRYAPHPLHIVVLDNLEEKFVRELMTSNGLEALISKTQFIKSSEIDSLEEVEYPRNILVLFSALEDHAHARTINAALRSKSKGGNVAYLAALTIAQSARAAEDLRIFLTYGSRGRDTFTFKSVCNLLLPYVSKDPSPWAKERAYLVSLTEAQHELPEIMERLTWLSQASVENDNLFLAGNGNIALSIQPDFVFLTTIDNPELVSQSDVFSVVSNLLACARAGKKNVVSVPPRGTPTWEQTSLYQVLLCPSNFRDFNDPVLRAALLRAADEQELNYVLDETSSAEMLTVLQAELNAWKTGGGSSLPEFLLALSTRRLRLTHGHTTLLKEAILTAQLEDYPSALASGFLTTN